MQFSRTSVILKAARGHSAGHQVLYLDLADTARGVVGRSLPLPGRAQSRAPAGGDYDVEQTRLSCIELDAFMALLRLRYGSNTIWPPTGCGARRLHSMND